MRRLRYLSLPSLLVSSLVSTSVFAAPWVEQEAFTTMEKANSPSSKVDAADLNGDGNIDLVFANGGGFDKGDDKSFQPQQAFLGNGDGTMSDASQGIFGADQLNGRVVKLRDIDNDGDNDIVLGTTWQSQSQLFLNDGGGMFNNETPMNLPQIDLSVGDLELGDVDYDGDLDMILAHWGSDVPVSVSSGGVTQLWSQMGETGFGTVGTAMFENLTLNNMPPISVQWSWELEFIDIDNDYDLDILISSFASDNISALLYVNDGKGKFEDKTAGSFMGPKSKGAYDMEPMDVDADGYVDLVTLHDGPTGRNRILLNGGTNNPGIFSDATDLLWTKLDNPASLDFQTAFYDYNSDERPDFVIGAFQAGINNKFPDRLVYFDTVTKKYKQNPTAFQELAASPGTFAIVLADFNKDTKLDMAMAQNENQFQKKLFLATDEIAPDTAAPFLTNVEPLGAINFPGTEVIRLRCNDNKSPLMLHDFKQTNNNEGYPYIETWDMEPADPDNMPGMKSEPGQWYGEYLWRVEFDVPDADALWYRLCAIDAANNKRCTPLKMETIIGGTDTESDAASDTDATESVTDGTDSQVSATDGTMSATMPTMSDSDTSATATITESDSTVSDTQDSAEGTISDTSTPTVDIDSNSDSAPTESDATTATASASETAFDTLDGTDLDDDGCGCNSDSSPTGGTLASLALLGLLGLRRRRK